MLIADGVNGKLAFDGDKIIISRKGFIAFLLHGLKGEKSIMLGSISSIQFKEAGNLTNGYIQFAFHGGSEAKGGIFQSTQDENSILFTKKQQANFKKIQQHIELLLKNKKADGGVSVADELKKFSEMYVSGFLTKEEFDVQKNNLLGVRSNENKDDSSLSVVNSAVVPDDVELGEKTKVGRFFGWVFGILYLIGGVALVIENVVAWGVVLLAALILLPPVYTLFKNEDGTLLLSTATRMILFFVFLITSTLVM